MSVSSPQNSVMFKAVHNDLRWKDKVHPLGTLNDANPGQEAADALKNAFLEPRGGDAKVMGGVFGGIGGINAARTFRDQPYSGPGSIRATLGQPSQTPVKPGKGLATPDSSDFLLGILKVLISSKADASKHTPASTPNADCTKSLTSVISGAGDDALQVWEDNAIVDGGAGDDYIEMISDNAIVSGGEGGDAIRIRASSIASGGNGDDWIDGYGQDVISGGAGNDIIQVGGESVLDGGDGNDVISTYAHSFVSGGSGDDVIQTQDHCVVDAGAGNDVVRASEDCTIKAGAGDDIIQGPSYGFGDWGRSNDGVVDGGAGDDYIMYAGGQCQGGEGNDYIIGRDVDGGTGDDVLRGETVVGGQGDDEILKFQTMKYSLGDGNDFAVVEAQTRMDARGELLLDDKATPRILELGAGISLETTTVTNLEDGTLHLSFGEGDNGITLQARMSKAYRDAGAAAVELRFADGRSLMLNKQV